MMPPSSRMSAGVLAGSLLMLCSCQTPPAGEGGETVRRAQSPAGGEVAGATSPLNVPMRASAVNEMARLLGGLETGAGRGTLATVQQTSVWPYHQRVMNSLWRRHERGRGEKMQAWASREIGDLQRYSALFYPFSGPDYLFAHEFFPGARTYVLCGLEPAEPLPDLATLSAGEVMMGLNGLRQTLSSIMDAGYFVTEDMRNDLKATRFRGVLPVLLAFLARTGATVDGVDIVTLDGGGNVVMSGLRNGTAPGLQIRFRSGGASRRLYYFQQDLSNSGTRAGGPFLTFVANQGTPPALVKSASYLMHNGSFSTIRNYLLNATPGIVQDPSGVPYRDLVAAGLDIRLYGNYQGTLGIFAQQQPDLMAAYRSRSHPVQSLDFGYGYLYRPSETSIIVSRRRP